MTYQTPVFRDKTLHCCDCGESFVWTAGEQGFYYRKSLSEPHRCKSCRELRKRTLGYQYYDTDIPTRTSPMPGREDIKYETD
jgi:hypothetical protein